MFFSVVFRRNLGSILLHFGWFWEAFWRLAGTFFEVCGNSEKCNPSQAKTMFLRFGEGPFSHFFDTFSGSGFEAKFLSFFVTFWCPGEPKGLSKILLKSIKLDRISNPLLKGSPGGPRVSF